MYSICGTTLAIALAALWVVFTRHSPFHRLRLPATQHCHTRQRTLILWSSLGAQCRVVCARSTGERALLRRSSSGRLTCVCLRHCLSICMVQDGCQGWGRPSPVMSPSEARSALLWTGRGRATHQQGLALWPEVANRRASASASKDQSRR